MREGSPPHTCHMSGVTCRVSLVTCHVSHVTCPVSDFFLQSGEASQGRVCYQWGLPRLVLQMTVILGKPIMVNSIYFFYSTSCLLKKNMGYYCMFAYSGPLSSPQSIHLAGD